MWDILEYLDTDLMTKLAARVTSLVRDGGVVFAIFHTRKPEAFHRYRVLDAQNLELIPAPVHSFRNEFFRTAKFPICSPGIALPKRSWGAISFAKAFSSSKVLFVFPVGVGVGPSTSQLLFWNSQHARREPPSSERGGLQSDRRCSIIAVVPGFQTPGDFRCLSTPSSMLNRRPLGNHGQSSCQMLCTGVQITCSSNVHGGEDDATGLRALTADITPLMRCVPRATPNMRRRGNCKSAGTGNRQAPRSCLRRDWNSPESSRVSAGLASFMLARDEVFAGFRVFCFFFARGALRALAGLRAGPHRKCPERE